MKHEFQSFSYNIIYSLNIARDIYIYIYILILNYLSKSEFCFLNHFLVILASIGKDCQFIPRLNLGGELSQIIEDLNLLYKVVDQLEIAITKVGDDKDKDLKTRTEGKSS